MTMDGSIEFEWWGIDIELLPGCAVRHSATGTLLVADVHLGKPASFRAGGIPVPEAVTRADLDRLGTLLAATGSERMIVLGDLAHDMAALGETTLRTIHDWRREWPGVSMQLVPGNHDRRLDDIGALGFELLDRRSHLGGLDLVHATSPDEKTPTLGGHVHPRVLLAARRGDRMQVPCFWFSGRSGILPAFGSFTGGHLLRRKEEDIVFAAGTHDVVRLGPGGVGEAGQARSHR